MKKNRMIRIILCFMLATGIIAGGAAIAKEKKKERVFTEAVNLFNVGDYGQAAEMLEELDGYSNSEAFLERCKEELRKIEIEEKAEKLLEQERPDEAITLLEANYPDSVLLPQCRQESVTAEFRTLVKSGDLEEAGNKLEEIAALNEETRLLNAEKMQQLQQLMNEAMEEAAREAEQKRREERLRTAQEYFDNSDYTKAFRMYRELENEEGMEAAVNALEDSGEYGRALSCVAEQKDYARILALAEELSASEEYWTAGGKLKYFVSSALNLVCKDDGEAAKKTADFLYGQIVNECKALLVGDHLSEVYLVLSEMEEYYPARKEELDSLQKQCVRELPTESFVMRSEGGENVGKNGLDDTATVTIHNRKRGQGAVIVIRSGKVSGVGIYDSYTSKNDVSRYVYVAPGKSITLTIPTGYYRAYYLTGNLWFGNREGFGINALFGEFDISVYSYYDNLKTKEVKVDGLTYTYMKGSYSTSFE